jgi:hypothetical protein
VDVVFPKSVFYIVFFGRRVPVGVKLMYLDGDFFELIGIEPLIDLAETSLAEKTQQLIFPNLGPAAAPSLQSPVPGVLFLI